MQKDTENILTKIYAAYGTDSGILFGIKEKAIVESIIRFTLNHSEENPTPDSKEGLHTQGEWEAGSNDTTDYIDITCNGQRICSLFIENENGETGKLDDEFNAEQKANAELIVKAVNEYEILKEARNQLCQLVKDMTDERQALLDALVRLEEISSSVEADLDSGRKVSKDSITELRHAWLEAHDEINNAKNIKQ